MAGVVSLGIITHLVTSGKFLTVEASMVVHARSNSQNQTKRHVVPWSTLHSIVATNKQYNERIHPETTIDDLVVSSTTLYVHITDSEGRPLHHACCTHHT
jgi:hypothetical protein